MCVCVCVCVCVCQIECRNCIRTWFVFPGLVFGSSDDFGKVPRESSGPGRASESPIGPLHEVLHEPSGTEVCV